ncbi:hypothetical protein ACR780_09325 [Sphingobacterium faecium]|uniref:hypothetical protein n=1 Tax=Sphingobacterium faecium TaxID=34087 RepID=UPI003DA601B3
MIPKYFLLCFCVLLSIPVAGQIIFVDSADHTPISGVNIYTRHGDLIGFSNKNGQFDLCSISGVLSGNKINNHGRKIKQ